jgi:aspartyl-tRNA(Asn)/glutamyl-tRNA(Gln) amidotransferase subunit A
MAAPRLTGSALAAVRRLAQTPLVHLIRRQALRDYGVGALYALGPADRQRLDVTPRPLQARPPRCFGEERLPAPPAAVPTAAALRAAFGAGTTTPNDVLARLVARLNAARWGLATFSPFSDLDLERARAAAEAATRRWSGGCPLGPLDGVPVSVKDEQDVEGLPTRVGTKYFTAPATRDAFVVRTLRDAGAVVVGKTKMTELGLSPVGYNVHHDLPRNVYSAVHGAGGSSTGAGVAVALGIGPIAVGADGGGSVRIPACHSGVFGLKPTFGRIGRTGDACGDMTVFHIGPLAASVQDIADWMAVCGAPEDLDDDCAVWATDRAHVAADCLAAVGRGVRGARIGVLQEEFAAAPSAIAGCAECALRELEKAGAQLIDVDIRLAAHASAIGMMVIGPEAMANLIDDLDTHADDMGDGLRLVLTLLRTMSIEDVLVAGRHRAALRRQAAEAFANVDLLALPTMGCPPRAYARSEAGRDISDPEGTRLLTRFAFFANLTGLPAASLPCGMAATGDGATFPAGLQLVGDAWDEPSVIAAMASCARAGVCEVPRPEGWASLLD